MIMAKLILGFNGETLREYDLDQEIMTIGRKTDNDIHIDNLAVSGNHARILTILDDSFIGGLVTDRRVDGGGDNTVFGGDISVRFLKNYRIRAQVLGSRTNERNDPEINEDLPDTTFDDGAHTVAFDGESYIGHSIYTGLERSARFWNFDVDFFATSPTFRAAVSAIRLERAITMTISASPTARMC